MKNVRLLFLFIVTWGCTSHESNQVPEQFQELSNLTVYSEDAKPAVNLSFHREVVYGDSDEVAFGRMGDIAVNNLGCVFIADVQKLVIYAFEPNGRLIGQLGRDGRGPGEFSSIQGLQIRGDRLYVFDSWLNNRVSVFSLDTLAGEETIVLARNRGEYEELAGAFPSPDELFVRNDGTFLARFKSQSPVKNDIIWLNFEFRGLYYPLDNTGNISSGKLLDIKIATGTLIGAPLEKGVTPTKVAFYGHLKDFFGNVLTVLSSADRIYFAEPDHFLINVYSPDGTFQRAFYYPHQKIPLTRESAIEDGVHEALISNMDSMDLSPTWPVLAEMKIDDQDRLWIATTVENMSVYEWYVLEDTGELITKFEWPRDEPIEVVRNGYMYTRETEEETGLQTIVRYYIEMTER